MAISFLALTLRRKPDLLNDRITSNGDLYDISQNANSKPKKVANGPSATLLYIKENVVFANASDGVGARTAIRAVLAQTALGWDTKPKSVSGAISASLQTVAVFREGQVQKMPKRAIVPAGIISKVGKAFSTGGAEKIAFAETIPCKRLFATFDA